MEDVIFDEHSPLKKRIRLTRSRWNLIVSIKHPELKLGELRIQETIHNPDEIRLSKSDSEVFLYYKKFGNMHLAVVARHNNGSGFVITAYYTDRIKEGNSLYRRKNG